MIPSMRKAGYTPEMAAAINASAATIGPIIPPSIMMVTYGAFGSVSIAALFMGGIVPGVLVGLTIMIVTYIWAKSTSAWQFKSAQLCGRSGMPPSGLLPPCWFPSLSSWACSAAFSPLRRAA